MFVSRLIRALADCRRVLAEIQTVLRAEIERQHAEQEARLEFERQREADVLL